MKNRTNLEKIYCEYEKQINKLCWEISKIKNYDFEELKSMSFFIFIECYEKFDYDSFTFGTFLWNQIRWNLLKYIKRERKKENKVKIDEIKEDTVIIDGREKFIEFFYSISVEAQEVIHLVFKSQEEIFKFKSKKEKYKKDQITKNNVFSFLKTRDWTEKKIKTVFRELKTELRRGEF